MSLGKCSEIRGQIHQTHETILKSISIIVSRNLFFQAHCAVEPTVLLDLVGKEMHGDVFAVERASVLYNICWFSLKSYKSDDTKYVYSIYGLYISYKWLCLLYSSLILSFV